MTLISRATAVPKSWGRPELVSSGGEVMSLETNKQANEQTSSFTIPFCNHNNPLCESHHFADKDIEAEKFK